MGGVYTRARSEEVAPDMRSAVTKARAVLEVTSFVEDLDRVVCADGEGALGSGRGSAARIRSHRFCSLRESLVPVVVFPIRDNFWAFAGRRVHLLNLSDMQWREVLSWAGDFRSALKVIRSSAPSRLVRTRDRDAALPSSPSKRPRRE